MVSQTSSRIYNSHIKGAIDNSQNKLVLDTIRSMHSPCTKRMLLSALNANGYRIDLVSLRRSVTDLSKPNPKGKWLNQWGVAKVRKVYDSKCPISSHQVGWYESIEKIEQLKLFN